MEVEIIEMKSNGQISIPSEFRDDIKEGDKLIIIKNDDQLILKKADFIKGLEEDLIFAKRTEEAFKRYQNGKFVEMDFDEFMEEASKW
ncbi:MAG: SpoVT / AbrB like domain protein [Candidatus Methanofastidiosum methylothiophilum]|uniref:SpoVT / AbrB like domain protein n=1 Tax=Candidatus Methanofastidiosum methylothiophilum TaxID=1705564 RepID=A0A150ILX3_9EURY|nr:MAG: SpoVT / AbrB like domain protein [Candidatus Methanofastidiosum methylthiophilus]KYC48268.1 MAG: SpoVT / AbrB like domain protein [Candidatus Methanofastidiosum methylthiophilus]KYC50925.1 MAG: SpoVT / AbrB like domain protein [Candidatus Methanofastidiosum methylthiophilus]